MPREETPWSVPANKNTKLQNIPATSSRTRNTQRNSSKPILKRKNRNRSKIPVPITKDEKNQDRSLKKHSLYSLASSSSSKKNKKPKKRKEWAKMPTVLETPINKSNGCAKSREKNKFIRPSLKKTIVSYSEERGKSNSKSLVLSKTSVDLKPYVTRKEYLQKVSSSSLIALKRIVSKKFRDHQINKSGNIHFLRSEEEFQCSSTSLLEEKYRLLAEENKKLLKNVSFRTTKVKTPKSQIPTRIPVQSSSKSSLGSLNGINKKSQCSSKAKLNISSIETTSFLPEIPQVSFVEKNKEDIKKIKKKTTKEEKKSKKSKPTYREISENRNVVTYNMEQNDESRSETLYVILYVLGNLARQIPQVIKNIFPNLLCNSVDQETHMSKTNLTEVKKRKVKKYEAGSKYLPPWEEYKHDRHNKLPYRSERDKEIQDSSKNDKPFESKSMADFYKRLEAMETKSFSVQVDEKVSTSQQCCSKDVTQRRSHRVIKRKSWNVDYGRTKKNSVSFLKIIRAAFKILVDSKPTVTTNTESEMRTSLSRSHPIKITRKHLDTDDTSLTDQLHLPDFCKLWKNPTKKKKYDKNLVYSYVATEMPKSSTSFLCPILSDKNKPVIIVNNGNNKKGKKLSKGQTKRKRGKYIVPQGSSLKSSSVPDIFYEAQESNSMDEISIYGSPKTLASSQSKNYTPLNATFTKNSSIGDYANADLCRITAEEILAKRPNNSVQSKVSNTSVYIDDPIETCDFGCDVSFVVCKDVAEMTDFVLEPSKSYCACESQYEHIVEEVVEVGEVFSDISEDFSEEDDYRRYSFDNDIGIEELIYLLKKEFSDDVRRTDLS